MLSPQTLPAIQAALREQRLDGWLLFDFQGLNPVARGMLGFDGLLSRRAFALVPLEGTPVAISHAIEQGPWKRWPDEWPREFRPLRRRGRQRLPVHLATRRKRQGVE